jgi:hypothetical protein
MKKLLSGIVFAAATLAAGSATAGVTFFEREGFQGMPLSTNGVIPDFRAYDFNDRTMSMVVQGAPVEVCVDIHFGGNCQVFAAGEYPSLIGLGWAGAISSVRPADGRAYGQDVYGRRGTIDDRRFDYSQRRRDGFYDPRYNRGY